MATLRTETYKAAARELRKFAERLELHCEPQTPVERQKLTCAVNGAARFARRLFLQHARRSNEH